MLYQRKVQIRNNQTLNKLKIKYEMNFKEKLTFYDIIEVSNSIIDNLNEIGQIIIININLLNRLHNRIYNWYVDGDLQAKILITKV